MNKELEINLKNLALEQLMQSKLGDKLEQAIHTFETVQKHLQAFSEKRGEEGTTTVKAVTVMTFSLLNKFAGGKRPSELSSEDWKEIAKDVSEYAVLQDEQRYTEFVFWMYERYIRYSVDQIEGVASEKKVMAIRELADELHNKMQLLESGQISEVAYIEESLWISLEAMIKLISSMTALIPDNDYAEFADALISYAFEYGRLTLYSREQVLVNEFIQSQYRLDKELEEKYAAFINDLEIQAEQFYTLIDNAFVPDFRETFLYSIQLAKTAGVDEKELLTDIDVIDSFFMD